jgi:hypothetical protein
MYRDFRRRFSRSTVTLLVAVSAVMPATNRVSGQTVPSIDLWSNAQPAAVLQPDDDELLDDMERTALNFFLEQSHPRTGLVRDRARADGSPSEGKASIAATGFALSAFVIGVRRGWLEREAALNRVRTVLRFLTAEAPRQHGFFYHFMEMDTGARAWKCELSAIDTGIFLANAILAREYFQDPEVTLLVNRLFYDIDWSWFLNQGPTLAMGWHDEVGFSRYRWDRYSEHMMLSFMGMGAQDHPLSPDYWRAWSRLPVGTYAGYHYIQGAPLFIHQYTHAYVDFRGLRDAYADYFRNSVLATHAQRQFCADLRSEFPSWGKWLWGISASDSATGYKAWGGPPRTTEPNALDGTIVPCAAAGSVPFAPYETMMTLRHMRAVYGERIWKRYGFVDAFNPETGWVNPDVIGIDQGITIVQAENARSGFVWAVFMHAAETQRALARAGFLSKSRSLPWPQQDRLRDLAAETWASLDRGASHDLMSLRLSAIVAARASGLINGDEAEKRARATLATLTQPSEERALVQYAASLMTLRQAIPSLTGEVARRLDAINWNAVTPTGTELGSLSRMTIFLQIAAGVRPVAEWTRLTRQSEKVGPVFVLAPATTLDQMLPGLWLDERSIITGASASQLAYSFAIAKRNEPAAAGFPFDVRTAALLIEHFPASVAAALQEPGLPPHWLDSAPASDRALLLISLANFLTPDCMREWFMEDALARRGRAQISEFEQAAFGENNSLFWRYELGPTSNVPPERRVAAVRSTVPRTQWHWVTMKGLEYRDSVADVRPGDPDLELRFAFTWDRKALHYHAEVLDTPTGFTTPSGTRGVELFVNPQNDGLLWAGPDDFQFSYRPNGQFEEWFHGGNAAATVRITEHGYVIDADIPWTKLQLTPRTGVEIGVSPAVVTEGKQEWDPSLKLNWRFYQRPDDRISLGVLRLE